MKELQSLDDVFNKKIFRIPDYQRGYAWGEKQLVEFWGDLLCLDNGRSHYTGVLSIKKVPEDIYSIWLDENWLIEKRKFIPYFIVDGQQRLTTVSIFIQCLIEVVRQYPDNIDLKDSDIYLGSYRLSEIIEQYIKIVEPKHEVNKTYKFGYEADNPSFEYLRYRIFQEPNPGTINETFYTLNLQNAKKFFIDNLDAYIESHGMDDLEALYEKLTTRFLFNLYELDDNFDVFVAFETMNNRGKQLSDLELLKNRLIYLTTLYPESEVSDNVKESTREKINKTWGEIYFQLGRNKSSPLNDDEFLRAHWIMYFKYSRVKGNDYIRYLLDEYFNTKNIFEKIEVSTKDIELVEELTDEEDTGEDDPSEPEAPSELRHISKRTIKDINDYVDSLKVASKVWYSTYFPNGSSDLDTDQQLWMDKINRVKINYFRPLIMAAIIRTDRSDPSRLVLLQSIEKFLFVVFRLTRMQANYRSSSFYRATRSLYMGEDTVQEIIARIQSDLEKASFVDSKFDPLVFQAFIKRKFIDDGHGFYAWNDLRYFLFEYEESLRESRGQPKLSWSNFVKSETDKVSIEHILPQTPDNGYWVDRFSGYSSEQLAALTGSLGNLLPLSSSINSSFQNDSFDDKKDFKTNDSGKLIRNVYKNGSYSEIKVSGLPEWTAENIRIRGLELLSFMEERWDINLGSEEDRLELLNLSFLRSDLSSEQDGATQ